MKRRAAALLFCLLLVFQLSLPPARAAERVYFTAVGSYVLPLSDNTMPFWSGGYVYIPSSIFTGAAQYSMNSVYADYIRAKETARPEGGSSGGTARPSSPSEPQDPAAGLDGMRIALCLKAGSDAAAMADALAVYGAGAAFFFTPEEMERQGGTLRRLTAAGQGIGILADASHPEQTVEEQLEAGNAALFRATCGKTRLAYIQNSGAHTLRTAGEAGFHCLRPDLDRSGSALRSASGAQELVRRLASWRGDAAVWLGDDVSPAGLRAFLFAARETGGECAAYTELGLR